MKSPTPPNCTHTSYEAAASPVPPTTKSSCVLPPFTPTTVAAVPAPAGVHPPTSSRTASPARSPVPVMAKLALASFSGPLAGANDVRPRTSAVTSLAPTFTKSPLSCCTHTLYVGPPAAVTVATPVTTVRDVPSPFSVLAPVSTMPAPPAAVHVAPASSSTVNVVASPVPLIVISSTVDADAMNAGANPLSDRVTALSSVAPTLTKSPVPSCTHTLYAPAGVTPAPPMLTVSSVLPPFTLFPALTSSPVSLPAGEQFAPLSSRTLNPACRPTPVTTTLALASPTVTLAGLNDATLRVSARHTQSTPQTTRGFSTKKREAATRGTKPQREGTRKRKGREERPQPEEGTKQRKEKKGKEKKTQQHRTHQAQAVRQARP